MRCWLLKLRPLEAGEAALDPTGARAYRFAELLLLGSCTGFLAGLLGIGGGMLMVPFLTMILTHRGVDPALAVKMAIATSMSTILFTSISSVRAHLSGEYAVRLCALTMGLAIGVLALSRWPVLTGADLPIPFGILPVSQDEHALCRDKVRFVGEPVAACVARTRAEAEAIAARLTAAEAEKEFWDHLKTSNTGMLGLDQPGYHSQPMTAFREEETGTIWFFTRDDTDPLFRASSLNSDSVALAICGLDREAAYLSLAPALWGIRVSRGPGHNLTNDDLIFSELEVLWDEINGDRARWITNPWVWAITFEKKAGERT